MVCWCVYWKTGLQFKIRVKKKDYIPTHYVPAYHLAHTLVCNEDQFSEALVLFTLGMQICQLDIDSQTVNMISCSIFNDPTLSLIARMIEKYACFKCWYLKYQSLDRKYVFIFIFSDICEEIIDVLLMEIIWIYLVHGHFMYCRNHIIVHE